MYLPNLQLWFGLENFIILRVEVIVMFILKIKNTICGKYTIYEY